MDQVASRRFLTAEQRVQFQFTPRGFCSEKVAPGQIFIPTIQLVPANILPPVLHTHSFIYHRRYTTLTVVGVFNNKKTDQSVSTPSRHIPPPIPNHSARCNRLQKSWPQVCFPHKEVFL